MDQYPASDASLRHLLPERWWETVAGLKVVTLKRGRTYGFELSLEPEELGQQLDQIVAQGFQAIEIFAPAAGRTAYSGLDTTDFFAIDPELGTLDDFRRLVRLAHSKGLAIVIFLNLGYFSVEAPDWITACLDPQSEQARWFSWADRADAPPPGNEDSQFYVAQGPGGDRAGHEGECWGWNYSELAGRYYWARWKAEREDGSTVGLPQTDWSPGFWPAEAARITRFWMDTGIDGMLIDAPLFYTGLTWEKARRCMVDVILSYGNTYVQPEGGRELAWITEGRCNSIQDYGLRLWGGAWQQHALQLALETGDASHVEEALRNYHDRMEAAGAVLYHSVGRPIEDPARRALWVAALAAIGDIVAYIRPWGEPGAEETALLKLRRAHPALHALGRRQALPTASADGQFAFLRTSPDGRQRVLVALNFKPEPQTVLVDTSGLFTAGFVELRHGTFVPQANPLPIALEPYGYRFLEVIPGVASD